MDRTEAWEIPPDAQIIDAAGMTIMPGIINSNQHLQLDPLYVSGDSESQHILGSCCLPTQ
jgi:imidazolonepropionase-like amidohydrolase